MKIGIVGCGMVGSTSAFALVMNGVGREIVLVDLNRSVPRLMQTIFFTPCRSRIHWRCVPETTSTWVDCRVVIIAAGVAQRPGETRLQLLQRNAAVFEQVVPSILQHAGDAVLVVVSNPVDIMTHLAAHFAASYGVPPSRVIGSGTMLDTARFRTLLGRRFGVDPHHVHAYVVGEQGDSEVLTWSLASIAGTRLEEFAVRHEDPLLTEAEKREIDEQVRGAAYHIIAGKGATYYGIGSAGHISSMSCCMTNERSSRFVAESRR
jgi:L-lactate dehydrogenase